MIEDPYEQFLGKIVFCQLVNQKTFSARLIGIDGDDLLFQNSSGAVIRDPRSRIAVMCLAVEDYFRTTHGKNPRSVEREWWR